MTKLERVRALREKLHNDGGIDVWEVEEELTSIINSLDPDQGALREQLARLFHCFEGGREAISDEIPADCYDFADVAISLFAGSRPEPITPGDIRFVPGPGNLDKVIGDQNPAPSGEMVERVARWVWEHDDTWKAMVDFSEVPAHERTRYLGYGEELARLIEITGERSGLRNALQRSEQVLTWAPWAGGRKCIYCSAPDTGEHAEGCWLYEELKSVRAALRSPSPETGPSAADLLAWMKARPGSSWVATIKDVEKAIAALTPRPEKES